jgi:glucose-6-phosphate dehydrogenase assembly protein OpcA
MITDALHSKIETIKAELLTDTVATTTINFLIVIDDDAYRQKVLDRVTLIDDKHPARTIVLDTLATGDSVKLDHDRIEIATGGMTPEDVRSLVQGLMIPEIPSVLWWTGDEIVDQPLFDPLIDIVDALVIDSSGSRTDDRTIRDLAEFSARRPMVALRDLAWMRLRPWQDMIAHFFDDPNLMEELFAIRKLEIVSGSDAEALYLGGWLASRLGWTACAHDEFCDRDGSPIPFAHRREGAGRRVRSVSVATGRSTYVAALTPSDEGVVSVGVSGERARADRLVPLQSIDNASLIERAILEPPADEVFETALHMVGKILS